MLFKSAHRHQLRYLVGGAQNHRPLDRLPRMSGLLESCANHGHALEASLWYVTLLLIKAQLSDQVVDSLDASTGNWTGSAVTPAASRSAASGTQAIEGSGMYKSGGEYYVFSSWDACCIGASDTYNIRVGRSSR